MPRDGKVIVVTGCSSGIGYALARCIRGSSHKLVATCREPKVTALREDLGEGDSCMVVPLDVTNSTQRETAVARVLDRFGTIDVLVNNAGISYRSVLEEMTREDDERQFATNFIGPLELMKLVIPKMRSARSGRIVNVSSVGGMMAMPTMGSYSASKFALEGASEALWYELKPFGVSITLVEPGFINSDSFMHVLYSKTVREGGMEHSVYRRCYQEMGRFIEKNMRRAVATPNSVAKRILEVIEREHVPLRIPVTIDAHVFALMRRFLPRRFYHALLYRMLPNISRWSEP